MPLKPGWLVRVTALLRSGGGPRQLAAGVALGLVGSVCPILGVPTPLLTVLALWKRLNLQGRRI